MEGCNLEESHVAVCNSYLTNLCYVGQTLCFFHERSHHHPLALSSYSSFGACGVLASWAPQRWCVPGPGLSRAAPAGTLPMLCCRVSRDIATNHQSLIPNRIIITDIVNFVSASFLLVAPLLTADSRICSGAFYPVHPSW